LNASSRAEVTNDIDAAQNGDDVPSVERAQTRYTSPSVNPRADVVDDELIAAVNNG
jgi:hypothetical protein